MMKTKNQVLAMMFIAALVFSACDDDNDGIKVSEAISQALKAKYPVATRVEWEQKSNYYVADCRMNGKDVDVWFDSRGEWKLTEIEIGWNDLPIAVQTTFTASKYATWEREDFDALESPMQTLRYVIEVEKGNTEYQLFYSLGGNLILEKDVTSKDDTHWPE